MVKCVYIDYVEFYLNKLHTACELKGRIFMSAEYKKKSTTENSDYVSVILTRCGDANCWIAYQLWIHKHIYNSPLECNVEFECIIFCMF